MTGDFTRDPDLAFPAERLRQAIDRGRRRAVDASSTPAGSRPALLGDAIGANMLLLGFAWQKGLIPLSREAIERAIELNGVAVALNQRGLPWGRRAAARSAAVEAVAGAAERADVPSRRRRSTN